MKVIKYLIFFFLVSSCITSYAMVVSVSINSQTIKDLKNLKIAVQTDESKELITLKEEDGFLVLPVFDPKKVKTIKLFIEYKGIKYITPDLDYEYVRVANHYCHVSILSKKKAKLNYNKRVQSHGKLSEEELKKNWIAVSLWGNERPYYRKKEL